MQRWNQLKLRMKSEGWNLSNTAYNMHYIKSRMKCRKDVTMGCDGLWLDQAVMKNLNHSNQKNLVFESILWFYGQLEALDEDISWSYHIFYESSFLPLFPHRNLKFEGLADSSRPIGPLFLTPLKCLLGKMLNSKNYQIFCTLHSGLGPFQH